MLLIPVLKAWMVSETPMPLDFTPPLGHIYDRCLVKIKIIKRNIKLSQ